MAEKIKRALVVAKPIAAKHGHIILITIIVFSKELGIAVIVDWVKVILP